MSRTSNHKRVRRAFDNDGLKRICEMHEDEFGAVFDLTRVPVMQRAPADFYYYKDNGASVLFVAHLDTCVDHDERTTGFLETAAGPVVHSGALDDRLGAYIGLRLLPRLGVNVDVLLTTGEEQGMSTALYFEPPHGKEYNWVIEFDRGGTDVVMYEYEDFETRGLVRDSGARVGLGSFSDICYLTHLEVKAFNWGVGYDGDYHSTRGYAYLEDTWDMVAKFLTFHAKNKDTYLPHEQDPYPKAQSYAAYGKYGTAYSHGGGFNDELDDLDIVEAVVRERTEEEKDMWWLDDAPAQAELYRVQDGERL